jgi:hypothetical protein
MFFRHGLLKTYFEIMLTMPSAIARQETPGVRLQPGDTVPTILDDLAEGGFS